jgi:hypothetical protein
VKGRYVEFDPNTVDPGSSVSWVVESVDGAGEYTVHLRDVSDAERGPGTARTATVRVENGTGTRVTLPTTGYWDEWTTVSTTVSLSAGRQRARV